MHATINHKKKGIIETFKFSWLKLDNINFHFVK